MYDGVMTKRFQPCIIIYLPLFVSFCTINIISRLCLTSSHLPGAHTPYLTDAPERSVYILAAMFIDCSSWNSSFAAYGMWTCAILVLFLQGRHSKDCLERFLRMLAY